MYNKWSGLTAHVMINSCQAPKSGRKTQNGPAPPTGDRAAGGAAGRAAYPCAGWIMELIWNGLESRPNLYIASGTRCIWATLMDSG